MHTIDSIQKIIKVGDSLAVTIPAKDARALGFKAGDDVRSVIEGLKENKINVLEDYAAFSLQYGSALKNLADR